MKLIDALSLAIKALSANKMRSGLTMLGIIIGVGAVIILMAAGAGIENMITDTFEELGTNMLFVQPANPDAPGFMGMMYAATSASLTTDDADALERIPGVTAVVPTNENMVEVVAGNENAVAFIEGTSPGFAPLYAFELDKGQFISEVNLARRDMVVVVGHNIAEVLFGDEDPVGQKLKMKDKRFTVIGVLEPRGLSSFGYSFDDVVVVPITTYQARLFSQKTPNGQDAVQSIAVQLSTAANTDYITAQIEEIMRKRHKITDPDDDDFAVTSPEQLLGTFETISVAITAFLGIIGSISLLVGSIGIMNIMLVSVTERTREIGLRKAIGAKRRDILIQFLLEAAMLSLVGGAIGLIGGWLISLAISWGSAASGFPIHATVSAFVVILAVSVSIIIGLLSGIYPAMRAARLNPIDALHYG